MSQQCAYSNADFLTTIQGICMKFSAFIQHSLMYRMYVKSEKHIFVINAGFLMTRHIGIQDDRRSLGLLLVPERS